MDSTIVITLTGLNILLPSLNAVATYTPALSSTFFRFTLFFTGIALNVKIVDVAIALLEVLDEIGFKHVAIG